MNILINSSNIIGVRYLFINTVQFHYKVPPYVINKTAVLHLTAWFTVLQAKPVSSVSEGWKLYTSAVCTGAEHRTGLAWQAPAACATGLGHALFGWCLTKANIHEMLSIHQHLQGSFWAWSGKFSLGFPGRPGWVGEAWNDSAPEPLTERSLE